MIWSKLYGYLFRMGTSSCTSPASWAPWRRPWCTCRGTCRSSRSRGAHAGSEPVGRRLTSWFTSRRMDRFFSPSDPSLYTWTRGSPLSVLNQLVQKTNRTELTLSPVWNFVTSSFVFLLGYGDAVAVAVAVTVAVAAIAVAVIAVAVIAVGVIAVIAVPIVVAIAAIVVVVLAVGIADIIVVDVVVFAVAVAVVDAGVGGRGEDDRTKLLSVWILRIPRRDIAVLKRVWAFSSRCVFCYLADLSLLLSLHAGFCATKTYWCILQHYNTLSKFLGKKNNVSVCFNTILILLPTCCRPAFHTHLWAGRRHLEIGEVVFDLGN